MHKSFQTVAFSFTFAIGFNAGCNPAAFPQEKASTPVHRPTDAGSLASKPESKEITVRLRILLTRYLTPADQRVPAVETELLALLVKPGDEPLKPNVSAMEAVVLLINDEEIGVRRGAIFLLARVLPSFSLAERAAWVRAFQMVRDRTTHSDVVKVGCLLLQGLAKKDAELLKDKLRWSARLSDDMDDAFCQVFAAYGSAGKEALTNCGFSHLSEKEKVNRRNENALKKLDGMDSLVEPIRLNREFQEDYQRKNDSRVAPQMPPTQAELERSRLRREVFLGGSATELINPTPGRSQARSARIARNRRLLAMSWPYADPPAKWKVDDQNLVDNDAAVLRLANTAAVSHFVEGRVLLGGIIATEIHMMIGEMASFDPPASAADCAIGMSLVVEFTSFLKDANPSPDELIDAMLKLWTDYSKRFAMEPEPVDPALVVAIVATRIHLRRGSYERCAIVAESIIDSMTSDREKESPMAGLFHLQIANARMGQKRLELAKESVDKAVRLLRSETGWEWEHVAALETSADVLAAADGPGPAAERMVAELKQLPVGAEKDERRLVVIERLGRLYRDARNLNEMAAVVCPACDKAKKKLGDSPLTARLFCLRGELEMAQRKDDAARKTLVECLRMVATSSGSTSAIGDRAKANLAKIGR